MFRGMEPAGVHKILYSPQLNITQLLGTEVILKRKITFLDLSFSRTYKKEQPDNQLTESKSFYNFSQPFPYHLFHGPP